MRPLSGNLGSGDAAAAVMLMKALNSVGDDRFVRINSAASVAWVMYSICIVLLCPAAIFRCRVFWCLGGGFRIDGQPLLQHAR
jgi:hypothetical protein